MKRYKRIILIMGLVMVFSLAGMRASVFASDDKLSRETLRGLERIYVLDVVISRGEKETGLSAIQIQTDVELKLRLAGIKILTYEESLEAAEYSALYIVIYALKYSQDVLIYTISVEFIQSSYLMRNPKSVVFGVTWSVNTDIGLGTRNKIRATVKCGVDQFINAYLSVNPKK